MSERGSASLALLGAVVVGMVTLLGLADLGLLLAARARAQTAADAAALAAAAETVAGVGRDPPGVAGRFAQANGAALVDCECRTGDAGAVVEVSVTVDLMLSGDRRVTARARAGVDPARFPGSRQAPR